MKHSLDEIYDRLETKFFASGLNALSSDEVVVFSVATFFGQMRDGGLVSVLSETWLVLVPFIPPSLRSIGADEYALIADEMLSSGTKCVEAQQSDRLEALEEAFWERFYISGESDMETVDRQLEIYAHNSGL